MYEEAGRTPSCRSFSQYGSTGNYPEFYTERVRAEAVQRKSGARGCGAVYHSEADTSVGVCPVRALYQSCH